jgi:hypothetical protein
MKPIMLSGLLLGGLLLGVTTSVAWAEAVKLPSMHHVVGVVVSSDMSLPDDFTLGEGGELICDTCHGIADIEDLPPDEVDTEAADFLHAGPYRELTEFCYRCHDKQAIRRNNVHVMRDDSGELDTTGCTYCHRETPDPEAEYEIETMEFQLPKAKLCLGCHLKTPHLNAATHQSRPPDEIRETMREAQRRHGVRLPLVEEDKVGCITCHTPHQAGVIAATKPGGQQVEDRDIDAGIAWQRTHWSRTFAQDKAARLDELSVDAKTPLPEYLRVESEILLRLPARDGTLCHACHSFEPHAEDQS